MYLLFSCKSRRRYRQVRAFRRFLKIKERWGSYMEVLPGLFPDFPTFPMSSIPTCSEIKRTFEADSVQKSEEGV